MRISDWSSDVCSSDLAGDAEHQHVEEEERIDENLRHARRQAALPPCDRYRTSCPLCHCAVPAPHRAASYATPPSRANGARRSLRTLRNPIAAAGPFSNPTTTGDTHATPCPRQRPALHPPPVPLQPPPPRTGSERKSGRQGN